MTELPILLGPSYNYRWCQHAWFYEVLGGDSTHAFSRATHALQHASLDPEDITQKA